ncbi:MAG: CaiB/BaiF CoA transferase family protein [Dehalococcoidia bacterium]
MTEAPLAGIRVLAMEQAVALPVGTRHLADMGADVIRVQSHARRVPTLAEIDLTRNKRQLALDLTIEGAPEAFLRVAANCDVVAHNYTPRVVRQFGIDYQAVRKVNPEVIYVSLTGFGTTGPWGERPLFGPGAEAVSGHNLLIGDPDGWPGRPGTIVYADTNCGLNAAFAVLAALDERDRTGRGQHIDVSLYETSVFQLGPALTELAVGAEPRRVANHDANFAIHGVFDCRGTDRHVAIAATAAQTTALMRTLGIPAFDEETVAAALAGRDVAEVAEALQAAGIAASVANDAADLAADPQLWARGFFGTVQRSGAGVEPGEYPHVGPAWGHGPAVPLEEARPVGADSAAVLAELGGFSEEEIADLFARGASGVTHPANGVPRRNAAEDAIRVTRGELTRIDESHDGWRSSALAARGQR